MVLPICRVVNRGAVSSNALPIVLRHLPPLRRACGAATCSPSSACPWRIGDELPNAQRAGGPPGTSSRRAIVLPGDELTVPAQDRVRCHEPGEFVEHPSAQYPTFLREAAALIVGEPQPPRAQLLEEDPVLLLEVVDHRELATVDPAREEQKQKLQRRSGSWCLMVACLGKVGPAQKVRNRLMQGLKIPALSTDRILAPDDVEHRAPLPTNQCIPRAAGRSPDIAPTPATAPSSSPPN